MHTNEQWMKESGVRFSWDCLSPRIKKDILTSPPPEDLPDILESVYIFGAVGSGKTLRAAFMYLKECERIHKAHEWANCVFVTITELLQNIKMAYDNLEREKRGLEQTGLSERLVIKHYSDCTVLFLDDFGMVKPTDWALQILYIIINNRYENLKKTVFTSNFSLQEVAKLYGDDRITSRIERMCQIQEKQDYHTKL
jgi:DNA replication protein DnaC